VDATPGSGMPGPPADDLAADSAVIERHLVRCAEDVLGAERAAVLADRLMTMAGYLALLSTACREPLFGQAGTTGDQVSG
jgi:hypothetical protein